MERGGLSGCRLLPFLAPFYRLAPALPAVFYSLIRWVFLLGKNCKLWCDVLYILNSRDRLLVFIWQVSWWLWSICVWTGTTSASHRPWAAARLWRPPASTWTPQAQWKLHPAYSNVAQPTVQASHKISIRSGFSILPCALQAWSVSQESFLLMFVFLF